MKSKDNQTETPGGIVSLMLFTILQPAVAGGLSEEKAAEIYHEVLFNIAQLDKTDKVFKTVLDDIINKLCIPYAIQTGYIITKNEN